MGNLHLCLRERSSVPGINSYVIIFPFLLTIVPLQIHFDLASFYFSREQYKEAKDNIWKASQIFAKLPKEKKFCIVEEETLKGYCKALGISSEEEQNLFVKFLTCKSNQFTVS